MSSFQIFDTTVVTTQQIIENNGAEPVFDTYGGPYSPTGPYYLSLLPGLPAIDDTFNGATGPIFGNGKYNIVVDFSVDVDGDYPFVTGFVAEVNNPEDFAADYGSYQRLTGTTVLDGTISSVVNFEDGRYVYIFYNAFPGEEAQSVATINRIRMRAFPI